MSFLFDGPAAQLTSNTLILTGGTFYAHLVTTEPLSSNALVSDLVLPANPDYTSVQLTGLSEDTQEWTFDNCSFPTIPFPIPPIGIVICRQLGSTPAATDQNLCYSEIVNSAGTPLILSPGNYPVTVNFGTNGAITK